MVLAGGQEAFDWIEKRTGCVLTERARAIKTIDEDGEIHGVVAYDCWTENAVQAHMAVDSPIAWRSLVRPAFQYPFEEAGLGLILAVIPAGNGKSVRLARHFGFVDTHVIKDGWAVGEDLLFLEMRRENCRWLREN